MSAASDAVDSLPTHAGAGVVDTTGLIAAEAELDVEGELLTDAIAGVVAGAATELTIAAMACEIGAGAA